jgi:hypothetical protein
MHVADMIFFFPSSQLLSAGAAEAKHPPQVDAAAFFTNLDVNGLFEFGFTSVGFLVFYFLVMPVRFGLEVF